MLPLDLIVLMAVPPAEEEPVPADQLELRLPDQMLIERGWSPDDWQEALYRLWESDVVSSVLGQGFRRTTEGDKIVVQQSKLVGSVMAVESVQTWFPGDEVVLVVNALRAAGISTSWLDLLHYVVRLGWLATVEMLPILIRRGKGGRRRDFQSLTAEFVDWTKF